MDAGSQVIDEKKDYALLYSICTIVNNISDYELMKQSFLTNGFIENCEYLVADNSNKNIFDAYHAIRRFLEDARGQYIIIVHQDVRCIDSNEKLLSILSELSIADPLWAICGNAGANGYDRFYFHLDDNGTIKQSKGLPGKVTSLDENFLVIKNDCHLTISSDLKGFHFYGTDLCIIADFLGYHCYVIGFMVNHLSPGNLADMELHKPEFISKYGRKLRSRFI